MELIYRLLRNIRYLLKNKKIITIIMIVIVVISLCKNIFAISDSENTLREDYRTLLYNAVLNYNGFNFNKHYTDGHYNLYYVPQTELFYLTFCEPRPFDNIYNNNSNTYWNSDCYVIDKNFNVVDVLSQNTSSQNLNTRYGVENVFISSNYCHGMTSPNNVIRFFLPILPFEKYTEDNSSVIIDGNFVVDAGSNILLNEGLTGVGASIPFALNLLTSDRNVVHTFILNSDNSYFDVNDFSYKISKTSLDVFLNDNTRYIFNIGLLNSSLEQYYNYDLFETTWHRDTDVILPGENTDTGDDNKDYSENFNKIENSINGTTSAIQDTNNFLKDENVNESDFNLPTVEVEDPSSSFFDTIFTGLYNAVTIEEDVIIGVDVMDTHLKISSGDFNFLVDERFSLIRTILSFSWIFGIGMFILKDIRKILDKIKNGDVDTAVTDDVKADMV